MKYYNCENADFVKTAYSEKVCMEDAKLKNLDLKGDICVCYIGKDTENGQHYVLKISPRASGFLVSSITVWNETGTKLKQYRCGGKLNCFHVKGDRFDAQQICEDVVQNKLTGLETYRYINNLARQQKAQNNQTNS